MTMIRLSNLVSKLTPNCNKHLYRNQESTQ